MKKALIILLLIATTTSLFAQNEIEWSQQGVRFPQPMAGLRITKSDSTHFIAKSKDVILTITIPDQSDINKLTDVLDKHIEAIKDSLDVYQVKESCPTEFYEFIEVQKKVAGAMSMESVFDNYIGYMSEIKIDKPGWGEFVFVMKNRDTGKILYFDIKYAKQFDDKAGAMMMTIQ